MCWRAIKQPIDQPTSVHHLQLNVEYDQSTAVFLLDSNHIVNFLIIIIFQYIPQILIINLVLL